MAQEAVVDTLIIGVETSSKTASADLDKVLGSLSRLETTVGKLSAAVNELVNISKSAHGGLENVTDGATDAASGTQKLAAAAKSSSSRVKYLSAALKGAKSGFKGFIDKVKSATQHSGTFFSSIMRIAKYRVIRSALRAIASGFSEGAQRMYEFATLHGMDFAGNMDRLASSLDFLKSSLGALVSPLVNLVTPALEYVINLVAELANNVGWLIATLTGQKFVPAIKRQTKAFEDSAGSVEKAVRQLMSFDELNVINTQKGRGGSGTSVSADEYYGERELSDFFKQIKSYIESQEWSSLGKLLGDKVNSLVDGINAADLGTKLGAKVQGALATLRSFVETTNWWNIGATGASFINNFISRINPEDLAYALTSKLRITVETALGFVQTLDWEGLGTAFGETLASILGDVELWGNLGTLINSIAKGLSTGIRKAIEKIDAGQVLDSIGTFFKNLGWEGALFLAMPVLTSAFTSVFALAIKSAFASKLVTNAVANGLSGAAGTAGTTAAAGGKAAAAGGSGLGLAFAGLGTYATVRATMGENKNDIARMNSKTAWGNMFREGGKQFGDGASEKLGKIGEFVGVALSNSAGGAASGYKGIDTLFTFFENGGMDMFDVEIGKSDASVKNLQKDIVRIGTTDVDPKNVLNFRGQLQYTGKEASEAALRVQNIGKVRIETNNVDTYASAVSRIANSTGTWHSNLKKIKDLGSFKATLSQGTITARQGAGMIFEMYGKGGMPDQGTLALIGENVGDTEILGNVNGRTGVVGGAEITGISDAVYESSAREMELIREQNNLLRAILGKTGNVKLVANAASGKWVQQAQRAFAQVTGE